MHNRGTNFNRNEKGAMRLRSAQSARLVLSWQCHHCCETIARVLARDVDSNAGEVIHEAGAAMRFQANKKDFVDLLHVYQTMSEALKIVAISRYKDREKLSCCAE